MTNRGSDMGQTTPMLEQVEQRTGVRPKEILVDGGYAEHEAIDRAAAGGTTMYAPLPKPRKGAPQDPHAPREGDREAEAAWRQRMADEHAKEIYKERAATAETANADAKAHRGLDRLVVRGRHKASGCAYLFALTCNILRFISHGVSSPEVEPAGFAPARNGRAPERRAAPQTGGPDAQPTPFWLPSGT